MPLPRGHRPIRVTEIRATLIKAIRIRAIQIRATEIKAIRIRALRILAMGTRPTLIKATRTRAMGRRSMWGHLRCALTATTPITRTPAHRTATMDQAGSQAGSLLAPGRGPLAMVGGAFTADVASMAGLALADAATLEGGRPTPVAEDTAVGLVTVTPDVPTVAVDVPSVGVDMPTVAVDTPSVAEGVPSVVAAAPLVAAVMVAGAVRFHDQLNVLAADSARCRPWRFQSRGQMAK